MYCPKCGKELPEGAQFCPNCGNSVNTPTVPPEAQDASGHDQDILSTEQQTTTPEPQQVTPPVSNEEVKCPKCGASGCVPQYKQNVSGGGYGCCQGVLGSLILGPLGLLCGMCGQSVKTTNNLVWICPKCGHEFQVITKESVAVNLNGLVISVEMLIAGLIMLLATSGGPSRMGELRIPSFLFAACGLCGAIVSKIALPEDPLSYLTDEQIRKIKIVAVILGVIFGGFAVFYLLLGLMIRTYG